MSEISPFIAAGAAVVALSPKSHGPALTAWAIKYAADQFTRDFLDTAGRVLYYVGLILACRLIELWDTAVIAWVNS
jgi:hypothetical protein